MTVINSCCARTYIFRSGKCRLWGMGFQFILDDNFYAHLFVCVESKVFLKQFYYYLHFNCTYRYFVFILLSFSFSFSCDFVFLLTVILFSFNLTALVLLSFDVLSFFATECALHADPDLFVWLWLLMVVASVQFQWLLFLFSFIFFSFHEYLHKKKLTFIHYRFGPHSIDLLSVTNAHISSFYYIYFRI